MGTPPEPAPKPNIPEVIYGMFCGPIDQNAGQKFVNVLAIASNNNVKHIHLLFQTAGGYVADGVFLYNLFRSMTIELTLYNVGQISSAGVIAYLGAKGRKAAKSATFMIHRSTNSPQFATATKLEHVSKSLILDDERSHSIIKLHTKLPSGCWESIHHHDLYISGDEAVKYGVSDAIAEFAPPLGTQVFNILG